MFRQLSDNAQALLAGEAQLLDLICAGAPLPQILDRVCAALDLQLGNVVSLALLPDDEEHLLHTFARSAQKFGLTAFSCTAILSPNADFLGTLETYCCFPRKPSLIQIELIERAAHLAALAIQHYNQDMDAESYPLDWKAMTGRNPREGPPSTN